MLAFLFHTKVSVFLLRENVDIIKFKETGEEE
jgi:hypothetical protein